MYIKFESFRIRTKLGHVLHCLRILSCFRSKQDHIRFSFLHLKSAIFISQLISPPSNKVQLILLSNHGIERILELVFLVRNRLLDMIRDRDTTTNTLSTSLTAAASNDRLAKQFAVHEVPISAASYDSLASFSMGLSHRLVNFIPFLTFFILSSSLSSQKNRTDSVMKYCLMGTIKMSPPASSSYTTFPNPLVSAFNVGVNANSSSSHSIKHDLDYWMSSVGVVDAIGLGANWWSYLAMRLSAVLERERRIERKSKKAKLVFLLAEIVRDFYTVSSMKVLMYLIKLIT